MRHSKARKGPRSNAGFTLFEMVVSICSIVVLYMIAEQRLNALPAAAERANFHAVLEQIKTGVSFEMITRLAAGRPDQIRALERTNPMNFLIETPANYEGELQQVPDNVARRNAWYFETGTGELVYVVGGSSIENVFVTVAGRQINLGQIRLKLTNVYEQGAGGASAGGSQGTGDGWQALVLAPVRDFQWDRSADLPIPVN